MKKMEFNELEQNFAQRSQGTICIHHEWPQLGRVLYDFEHDLSESYSHLTDQQKAEQRERIKEATLEQCRACEKQYEAFEFVRKGRAVEIVGNPHYMGKDGREYELPYTGLEGCYVGSEEKPGRPGLTPSQILEEEANIGLELVKRMKKHYIDHYSWTNFAKIQKASENERADVEDLRHLNLLWTGVVRRLNQRIYENEEGKISTLELLEALFRNDSKIAKDPRMQAIYTRLLEEEKEESEEERKKKQENERIFRSRLAEHRAFREETYARLKDACGRIHHIDYVIKDSSFADATITETLYLPEPPNRNRVPSYLVDLTAEQLEGYLFLASLGEKGGNPLTRSVLTEHTYSGDYIFWLEV